MTDSKTRSWVKLLFQRHSSYTSYDTSRNDPLATQAISKHKETKALVFYQKKLRAGDANLPPDRRYRSISYCVRKCIESLPESDACLRP